MAVASGFIAGNVALAHSPVDFLFGLFFSAGAFFLYQVDRAFSFSREDKFNNPERVEWIAAHRRFVTWSMGASAVVLISILPWLPAEVIPVSALIGIVGIVHALPGIPGRRRIKSFPLVKTGSIAGAWILGGVILPLGIVGDVQPVMIGLICVYRLPIILANLMVADFLDRHGDRKAGLNSFYARWPEKRIKQIAIWLISFSAVTGIAVALIIYSPMLILVDIMGHGFMIYLVVRSHHLTAESLYRLDILVGWPLVTFVISSILQGTVR